MLTLWDSSLQAKAARQPWGGTAPGAEPKRSEADEAKQKEKKRTKAKQS